MIGVTFDAGGLIALDRDDRHVVTLLKRLLAEKGSVTIPAPVLAQVWRDPARQARISSLARHPQTIIEPLTAGDAAVIGRMLRRSRTADVVDAHVVVCAKRHKQTVLTSDPKDLRAIDPSVRLVLV